MPLFWLKRARKAGLLRKAQKTWGKKIEKQVHLVFGFSLRVEFEPALFFSEFSASLATLTLSSSKGSKGIGW